MVDSTSDKHKILFISLYTEIGGGEVGLLNLLKNLDKSRFIPIVMFNKHGKLVEIIEKLGFEIAIVPFVTVMLQDCIKPGIFLKNFYASWKIKRFIDKNGIEIAQCNDVLSVLLLLPSMIFTRVKIVFNVIFFYERIRALLLNILSIFGIKYIVTLSSAVAMDLKKKTFGLSKKIKLVYWGVDTTIFYPRTNEEKQQLRKKLGLPIDKKLIGFVGRFELWKGHDTFLEAAGQLLRKRNDLYFVIVGGSMTEDVIPDIVLYRERILKRIDELKLQNNLFLMGNRDDVPDIMASLDVFVCPSDREPFGLVVLEALASGVPAVISSTVGAAEVLNGIENVFVAEPRNPTSFSDRVIEALVFSETNMSGKQTQRLFDVLSQLTWDGCAKKYEQIYEDCLIRSRRIHVCG